MKNGLKKEKIPVGMRLRHTLLGHKDVIYGVAWSPNGLTLASASWDNTVRLWDGESGKLRRTLEGHTGNVYGVSWSPDGLTLASASSDGTVRLWDGESGKLRRTLEGYNGNVYGVSWSPDGLTLASASSDMTIRLWDGESGKLRRTLEGHTKAVLRVSWSPDGQTLASASEDETVRLWDGESGRLRRTLEGHTGYVWGVSWSPDGLTLASASEDRTVLLWDGESGKLRRILEGHTEIVWGVSWSPDGLTLASASSDMTILLWDGKSGKLRQAPEAGSPIGLLLALTYAGESGKLRQRLVGHTKVVQGVAWSPDGHTLASVSSDKTVRLWCYDTGETVEAAPSTQYTNAKVVLVGDSGVGKTGLGLVLSGEDFVPTDSSHGRRVWTFDSREVDVDGGCKEMREILLWDLAGQPGYRLIHQLHLDEVAVALIVFDARSETDPFGGVLHWQRALKLAQKIQGKSAPPMRKILVSARNDRGGIGVSPERIYRMMRDMGLNRYVETSAREGWGIEELVKMVHEFIDWELMPKVSSTELFHDIKAFLIKEKEEGRLLSTADDLYRAFLKTRDGEAEDLRAEFDTCIGRVEARGLIRRLGFGGLILLQPELLDSYASAMVNEARNEPEGMGCILEERARAGDFYIPEGDSVKDKDQEKLLLIATVEDLLSHEIALREGTDHGTHLVFPSQFTRENPELPDPGGRAVIFGFEGPVLNVYTTLVVRLAHSGMFGMKEMWRNAVLFGSMFDKTGATFPGYGIWLNQIGDGRAELTLFFKEGANEEICFQFEEYVCSHLQRKALTETVTRRRIFVCPECDETITDRQAQRRQERGFKTANCPVCDREISLLDREERLVKVPRSAVADMDRTADERRDRETAASRLQGKIETGDFDVFLAHNSQDKDEVKRIGERLKERGILPWLDEWEIPPFTRWQDELQKVIPQVKAAAVFVGPSGIGPWEDAEINAFLDEFVRRKIPMGPVLLPGCAETPELPLFLKSFNWVDFRKEDPDPFERLIWGITGKLELTWSITGKRDMAESSFPGSQAPAW